MQVCAFENLLFTAAHSKRLETHTLETFVIYPGLPDVKNTVIVFTAGCSERVTFTTSSDRSFDVAYNYFLPYFFSKICVYLNPFL